MSPLIYLAAAGLAPIVVALVLRVNAAVLFMGLCVGEVLVQYLSGINTNLPYVAHFSNTTVQIALLFLPAALTTLVMIHSVKGAKFLTNIAPAVAAGLLAVILLEPLLPGSLQAKIVNLSWWGQISHWQPYIIAGGAAVSLLALWTHREPRHGKRSR